MVTGRGIHKKQRGAILITALVFMLVLTFVAAAGIKRSVLEERMAGNDWELNRAFQAAETGLVDGAQWLNGEPDIVEADGTGSAGVWESGSIGSDVVADSFDWATKGILYGSATADAPDIFSGHYSAPRYVIEETAFVPDGLDPDAQAKGEGRFFYTVTSIGYGGTEPTRVRVQGVRVKRYR